MQNISEFFSKILGKHAKEVHLRTVIQEILKKYIRTDLPLESIILSGGVLSLKGIDQTAKSVIFIKKATILKELNEKSLGRIVSDIRL